MRYSVALSSAVTAKVLQSLRIQNGNAQARCGAACVHLYDECSGHVKVSRRVGWHGRQGSHPWGTQVRRRVSGQHVPNPIL